MAHTDGKPDYDNTTDFPAFTTKEDILQAVADPANSSASGVYELCARLANTNLGIAVTGGTTTGISNFTISRGGH